MKNYICNEGNEKVKKCKKKKRTNLKEEGGELQIKLSKKF